MVKDNMSSMKPDTKYIYERDGSKIYAREFGATERHMIGYTYGREPTYKDRVNWSAIIEAAETNKSLATALEQVIMLYELTKDEQSS